jgi:hypothetical protein
VFAARSEDGGLDLLFDWITASPRPVFTTGAVGSASDDSPDSCDNGSGSAADCIGTGRILEERAGCPLERLDGWFPLEDMSTIE